MLRHRLRISISSAARRTSSRSVGTAEVCQEGDEAFATVLAPWSQRPIMAVWQW